MNARVLLPLNSSFHFVDGEHHELADVNVVSSFPIADGTVLLAVAADMVDSNPLDFHSKILVFDPRRTFFRNNPEQMDIAPQTNRYSPY